METLKNPQSTPQSNTITVEELAAEKYPIKPTDCWLVRRKKLWQREQFIANYND